MKINKSDLLAVAVKPEQYPPQGPSEVAFAGRSNVGKSSLLNLLTKRKKLARVSGAPGKTRTINFYTVNDDQFRIVDLPGYGYAKVSKSESAKWGGMIEKYLTSRDSLKTVVLLTDIRHAPTEQDVQMYEFLKYYGLSGIIAVTKADKVSRNAIPKQVGLIRETLGAGTGDVFVAVSALKKTGVDELIKEIGRYI
jgi:GTP-binding protein